MILVDSPIWIDYLRHGHDVLSELLQAERVLMHPFIIGELALGYLRDRTATLSYFKQLPASAIANDEEVAALIESCSLAGSGIGYIDAHLLASVLMTPGASVWTRDTRMLEVAERLRIAARLHH